MSEQWKIMGDCSNCRRKDYCKKECAAHKRLAYQIFKEAITKRLEEQHPGITTALNVVENIKP